ncbi:MAG: hypothetical protein ACLFRA_07695, partial [Alphaproteobacteria bacterium]
QKFQNLPFTVNEKGQPVPTVISLEEAVITAFEEFRQDIHEAENTASGLYLSYIGKNGGRALRLAFILEMLWWAVGSSTCLKRRSPLAPTTNVRTSPSIKLTYFLDASRHVCLAF